MSRPSSTVLPRLLALKYPNAPVPNGSTDHVGETPPPTTRNMLRVGWHAEDVGRGSGGIREGGAMRAVVWHGRRDVRVETVPDPSIEEPTDAIIRITSTGLCGSDLHLYEVMAPFMTEGDILGHEPMGIVEEVGAGGDATSRRATGSSSRSTSPAVTASCAATGLQSQCETTQVREHGKGAALFGYTKLYGQVPGRPGRVPAGPAGAVRPDQGARGPARRPVRVSSPTCCRRRGRRCEYAAIPEAARWSCSGLGPIGEMSRPHRDAPRACTRDRHRPRAGAARASAGATASTCSTSTSRRRPRRRRSAT